IVALLLYSCRASTILQLGDATATSLGVNPLPINRLRVIGAVILTALTVSTVGSLGFIGLMAPHLTRRIVNGGQSYLLCG
uniref:iron chelate uptake ABC transporter family permease subunit n=2 Tax=Rosenbergiella TaxID=1356488 RepID=UPI001F4D46FE